MRKLALLIVLFLLFAAPAFSAVGIKEDGTYAGEATAINLVAGPSATFDGSTAVWDFAILRMEEHATADTPTALTTTQGGTTFILSGTMQEARLVKLPTITSSNNGLWYKIIAGGTGTYAQYVVIKPAVGQRIEYCLDAPLDINENMKATDSYPAIRLIAWDGVWKVGEIHGNWINNGTAVK